MKKIGDRVGAILCASDKKLEFLGYGVYQGDTIPTKDAGGMMAKMLCEAGIPNPTIKLDNGDIVYGCECWWGDEESVKAKIKQYEAEGFTVEIIKIADARVR